MEEDPNLQGDESQTIFSFFSLGLFLWVNEKRKRKESNRSVGVRDKGEDEWQKKNNNQRRNGRFDGDSDFGHSYHIASKHPKFVLFLFFNGIMVFLLRRFSLSCLTGIKIPTFYFAKLAIYNREEKKKKISISLKVYWFILFMQSYLYIKKNVQLTFC